MRKRSPLSPYNRADAMFRKADDRPDPEAFNGLKLAAINELQLFYLFVKLSGVTDGLYDNYMNPDFQPSVILDANGDHMKFGDVKKMVLSIDDARSAGIAKDSRFDDVERVVVLS